MHIDLNCDMGEGIGNDAVIMPFISSANVACGYHAGDEATMRTTMLLAMRHGVKIGAHPSFPDRKNFGRTEMHLPLGEVYQLIVDQLRLFQSVADACNATIHHIKPHGALYNMVARDKELAGVVAAAIRDYNPQFVVYGLSNSYLISEAQWAGLKTANEVFADRTYQDDGSLTPRSQPNALIKSESEAVKQALQMIEEKTVTTVSGKQLPIMAETVCIHGDGVNAVQFAKAIFKAMRRTTGDK